MPSTSLKLASVLVAFAVILLTGTVTGQTTGSALHFIDYQRSIPKVLDLMNRKEDTMIKQFREKGLVWPARYVYIRSFKYDSELEVWVKNTREEKYRLFKTYKICAMAGTLGPKRMAGDYQVPEGFYYISEFNPKSEYHLSLGLNYPNASDHMLSDSVQPGGDIYIHGSCVTTGCIPITDTQIEELYLLALHAKDLGEDFIPVHIFPVNFNNPRSVEYLNKYLQSFSEYTPFVKRMRTAFNYFEKYREVPFVMVNGKGEYVTDESAPAEAVVKVPNLEPVSTAAIRKKAAPARMERVDPIPDNELATSVDKLPEFPGGNGAFQVFLNKLSKESARDLAGQSKAFVMVEYVIDSTGRPVYAKAIRGGNDVMDEKIEDAFLGMPQWEPATHLGNRVAMKLKQTVMIGAD